LTAGAGGTTNFEPLYDLSQSVRAGTVSDLVNNNRAFISAVDLALPLDLRDALLLEEVQVINANKDFIISALENIRNPDQLIYKFVYSGNSSADIKNSNISKALEDLESDDYEKVKTFIRDINLALIKAQTYISYNI
jgi:hypothetical protein